MLGACQLGEVLVLGDDIKVHVLGISGNQIRLGIDAPKNITVHREEVYKRIALERIGNDEVIERNTITLKR